MNGQGIEGRVADVAMNPQQGSHLGDDPELMQGIQEALAQMSPEEMAQLQAMSPEELAQFLEASGVAPEDIPEAMEILDIILSQMGDLGQQVPQMGQGGY